MRKVRETILTRERHNSYRLTGENANEIQGPIILDLQGVRRLSMQAIKAVHEAEAEEIELRSHRPCGGGG